MHVNVVRDLAETADVRAYADIGPRSQPREWPNGRTAAYMRVFDMGKRVDNRSAFDGLTQAEHNIGPISASLPMLVS